MDLKKTLNIAAEILVTTVIILAAFYAGRAWTTRPWPDAGKKSCLFMDTNPGKKARNQIVEPITGRAEGHIKQIPWVLKPTLSPSQTRSGEVGDKDQPGVPSPSIAPWSAEVPISGEITAKFTDKKNGNEWGSETKPLDGTVTVTGSETGLAVETKFTSELNFAVDVPEPDPKPFHMGAFFRTDPKLSTEIGGYVQYDFLLRKGKNINVLAPVRVELLPDGWRGMVGIEFGF